MSVRDNKNLRYAVLFSGSLLLAGCCDELYRSDSTLSTEYVSLNVAPANICFAAEGGEQSIDVEAAGAWSLGRLPMWISAVRNKNGAQLTAEANPTATLRTAIVEVTAGEKIIITESVELTQLPGQAMASFVEDTIYEVSAAEQVLSVPYTANLPTSEVGVSNTPSWIEPVVNENTVDFKISANASTGSRSWSGIYLNPYPYLLYKRVYVAIEQRGAEAEIEGDAFSKDIPPSGGNYTIKFKSNAPWEAFWDESWISVSPEKGDKADGDVIISVSENLSGSSRSAEVRFGVGGDVMATYNVIQKGLRFDVEPNSITLDCEGLETGVVALTANTPWEVCETPQWVTVTPSSGEGGMHAVALTAVANESVKPRSFNLQFRAQNNHSFYSDKVAVTQSGQPNGASEKDLKYGWPGGTQTIDIITPGEWQCAVSDSWISLSQGSGAGEGSLGITVQPNSQATDRVGSVLLHLIDDTQTINIRQQGQYFYIDNSNCKINALGGDIELTVFTTVGASAHIDPEEASEWLTFAGPNDQGAFVITAAYNPSTHERNANFVLSPTMDDINEEYAQGLVYNIIQGGRTLEAAVPKIYIGVAGGASHPCRIMAEGGCRVWKDEQDSWYILQIDKANSAFTINATPNNTGTARSGVVHIELTGLPEGESKQVDVEIRQLFDFFDVGLGEFGEDEQWK